MHRLTFEQEKELIDYFRLNQSLWNTKDKNYNNRTLRQEKLEYIANRLNLTRKDVYEKYRNLRTTFFREHKRVLSSNNINNNENNDKDDNNSLENDNDTNINNSTSTTNQQQQQQQQQQKYVSRWRHYKNMLFLVNNNNNNNNNNYQQLNHQIQPLTNGTRIINNATATPISINNNGVFDGNIRQLLVNKDSIANNDDVQLIDVKSSGNKQNGGSGNQQQEVIIINAPDVSTTVSMNGAKSIHAIPISNVGIIGSASSTIAQQRIPYSINGTATTAPPAAANAPTISAIHHPTTFSVIQAPSTINAPTTISTHPSFNNSHQDNHHLDQHSQQLTMTTLTPSASTSTPMSSKQQQQQQSISVIEYPLNTIRRVGANSVGGAGGHEDSTVSSETQSTITILTTLANHQTSKQHLHLNNSGSNSITGSISPIKSISQQQHQQQLPIKSPYTSSKNCFTTTATKDYHHSLNNRKQPSINYDHQQINNNRKQSQSTIRLSKSTPATSNPDHQQQQLIFTNCNNNGGDTPLSNEYMSNSTLSTNNSRNSCTSSSNSSNDQSSISISKLSTTISTSSINKSTIDLDEIHQIIRTIVNDTINNNHNDNDNDGDWSFCRCLAASLRSIEDKQRKEIVKFELQKVILKFTNPDYYQQQKLSPTPPVVNTTTSSTVVIQPTTITATTTSTVATKSKPLMDVTESMNINNSNSNSNCENVDKDEENEIEDGNKQETTKQDKSDTLNNDDVDDDDDDDDNLEYNNKNKRKKN